MAGMGLCFDPNDDEKLARGWPNCVVPIDGHKSDKQPAKAAMKAKYSCDAVYFTEWPRDTLSRYLHIGIATLSGPGKTYNERKAQEADLAPKAAEDSSPVASKDAIEGLRQMFRKSEEIYPFQVYAFVYGVETIAGTDAVLDALTEEIAACKKTAPSAAMVAMAEATGFLLLRASPAGVKRARAALEAVHASAPKAKPNSEYETYLEGLDCSLHGASAVRPIVAKSKWVGLDCGDGLGGVAAVDYADDPDLVRELVAKAKKNQPMSVRVAWLGGTQVLSGLSERKWAAAHMPSAVRDFGMIRAPEIVDFMLSVTGKSSVKDGPITWFRAHADYARPILAKSKNTMAKGVLRQLG